MPSAENVISPINIHGVGRSGTTLLQNILSATGFIQICNETAGLVFGCYRGGELLIPSHDKEATGISGEAVLAVRALHGALCAAMPSRKPGWCQKLGGIPKDVVWRMIEDEDLSYAREPYAFPYRWFWQVLRSAFPFSKDLLIIRDWRDVIVSRMSYSGYAPEEVAADIAVYFNLMAHPDSGVDHVVRYEELTSSPGSTLQAIFSRLGLAYSDQILVAMEWYAAPCPDRSFVTAREAGFSRKDQHGLLITADLHRMVYPAIERLATKFGLDRQP